MSLKKGTISKGDVIFLPGKTAKRAKCNTPTRKEFSGKNRQRWVTTKWSDAKLIGEKAKVKVATLQWTKPRKWTLWRRMSYWKWGFSTAMLVYQRVIPPNGGTCFYKVRSKGLTKLQPWRALRNVCDRMALHLKAMHNSPTAFSNHSRSTLVSLMRPNRCSIWAPLLAQFWKENIPDRGNFVRYILGNVLSELAIRSWSKSNRLWFSFGNRNSTFSGFKKGIAKHQAFSDSRQFDSSEGPIKRLLWSKGSSKGPHEIAQGRGIASCRTACRKADGATVLGLHWRLHVWKPEGIPFFPRNLPQHFTGTGLHHWQGSSESPEEKGGEGSSNQPFGGEVKHYKCMVNLKVFPSKPWIPHCFALFGLVLYDPCRITLWWFSDRGVASYWTRDCKIGWRGCFLMAWFQWFLGECSNWKNLGRKNPPTRNLTWFKRISSPYICSFSSRWFLELWLFLCWLWPFLQNFCIRKSFHGIWGIS